MSNSDNTKPIRENFLVFGCPRIEEAEIEEVIASGGDFACRAGSDGVECSLLGDY